MGLEKLPPEIGLLPFLLKQKQLSSDGKPNL